MNENIPDMVYGARQAPLEPLSRSNRAEIYKALVEAQEWLSMDNIKEADQAIRKALRILE